MEEYELKRSKPHQEETSDNRNTHWLLLGIFQDLPAECDETSMHVLEQCPVLVQSRSRLLGEYLIPDSRLNYLEVKTPIGYGIA